MTLRQLSPFSPRVRYPRAFLRAMLYKNCRRSYWVVDERIRAPRGAQQLQADFKEMVKTILVRYGVKKLDFLRSATSPKLEPLGVSLLMPSTDELGPIGDGKTTSPSPERSRDQVINLLQNCSQLPTFASPERELDTPHRCSGREKSFVFPAQIVNN